MNTHLIFLVILIIVLTLLSGLADAQGFIHAASAWENGKIIWHEALKALLGFGAGALCYVLVTNFLKQAGIVSAEIQTLLWLEEPSMPKRRYERREPTQEWQPDDSHFPRVGNPRLYQHRYQSAQHDLWQPGEVKWFVILRASPRGH